MTKLDEHTVRIEFRDPDGRVESLSAQLVGEGLYRVEESPSFAYSVSVQDVVRATEGGEGLLRFEEVVEKSGNRTLRLLFPQFDIDSKQAQPILEGLSRLGCKYDYVVETVLRVVLPADVALEPVVEYMKKLEMWWEHADPTFREVYNIKN